MRLVATPTNPIPDSALCLPVFTEDGLTLRAMVARVTNAKGTVIVLGGRADFLERYFETAREIMDRGLCVAGVDFRGQGGSQRLCKDPMRGHARSFAGYDEDVRAFMTQVVLPNLPPPYYLLAHSTGGHVALRVLLEQSWFKKALLTSPLLDVHYQAWPVPVVQALTWLAKVGGMSQAYLPGSRRGPMGRDDFTGNLLTHDRRRWLRDCAVLEAAPELSVGGPTYGWLRAALNSFAKFRRLREGTAFKCPVLAVLSGKDQVVDNRATRDLERRVASFATVTITESHHEILTETDVVRAQFLAVLDEFFNVTPSRRSAKIAFAS